MNEKSVIKKCQKGNKAAFDELISFYYPYVSGFLLQMTCSRDTADDLTQETFIKIIRNIDKFDVNGTASFGTYLITVAKNCYIDMMRKNSRRPTELNIDDYAERLPAEYDCFIQDDYETLMSKIETLPPMHRDVIRLKYFEGYTLAEIAEAQKIECKTVKSRLYEARQKLKKSLKGLDTYD